MRKLMVFQHEVTRENKECNQDKLKDLKVAKSKDKVQSHKMMKVVVKVVLKVVMKIVKKVMIRLND